MGQGGLTKDQILSKGLEHRRKEAKRYREKYEALFAKATRLLEQCKLEEYDRVWPDVKVTGDAMDKAEREVRQREEELTKLGKAYLL